MMKRIIHRIYFLILLLVVFACSRDLIEKDMPVNEQACVPEGEPVTMYIPFSSTDLYEVSVGTKAEAAGIDETRIHDLYVMVFDNTNLIGERNDSPKKIYGRFFSYDHLKSSLTDMVNDENECWYVKNKAIGDGDAIKTQGAVKISTISCTNATLVIIANVANAVMNLDGRDELDRLRDVQHLKELQGIQVCLEQDVVNRKDLFLMTGTLNEGPGETALNTGSMKWGTLPSTYNTDYKVTLTPVDAKVKFRVKVNPTYISAVKPVYWQVLNTPDRCYLDSSYDGGAAPEDILHFASQQYYFEGTEIDGGDTYYTFCFYMLENRQTPNGNATQYFQREQREKIDTGESGYQGPNGPGSGSFSDHFVENGNWAFAPTYGTYVQFDLVLTLTPEGIDYIGGDDPEGLTISHALTSDAIFTVHLGDFDNSGTSDAAKINNYRTERGHFYTYNITVTNTKSIFTEVETDNEVQAGQEGFLLLTDSEIINADCHYEYHQLAFPYRPDMNQRKFSWYVKTPFGEGGPTMNIDEGTGEVTYSAEGLDYLWVKFGLNHQLTGAEVDTEGTIQPWYSEDLGTNVSPYSRKRHKYPGDNHYDPDWKPGSKVAAKYDCYDPNRDIPDLMDITQLIQYVFSETTKETEHRRNPSAPQSAFIADNASPATTPVLRFTAFINEYYYEENPLDHTVDPDLWRKFVNAQPRELHILSDARQSRDRNSDVILSSHSVIQQSIQTIYNIHAADLNTLWGTEHIDENRNKFGGWAYWPGDLDKASPSKESRFGDYTTELGKWNGRLNSAYIWEFWDSNTASGTEQTGRRWDTYLDYNVHNDVPELVENYQGMAYSCLSRNRDNNGNGVVDRNEVRWYLAACNQLVGMWVGNESLSIGARLYNPAEGQWRAHIISSTDRRVSWSEEGGGATMYVYDYNNDECWENMRKAAAGESVRCLRNIGTYNDPEDGTLKDISYAPYSQEIDHYFTKEGPDPTGPYTFYFDRLNPKSIREYSEGELPYANQFNISNCVYLKLETQSRANNVGDTADDRFDKLNTVNKNKYPTNQTINKEVTALGYNPYCPPGYRFPNHTEMVLMSLYLPNAYFDHDKYGNAYSDIVYMPSRSYYDRGFFEKNETGGMSAKDISREQNKVGWGYSTKDYKPHCAKKDEKMYRSRCVRDMEMTGHIDGGIIMDDTLYPGDTAPLSFSFFSSGSSFVSAALKLCYTDGSGVYHERDIPVQKTPTGLQFLADQTVTLPTLASVGLTEDNAASANWKFKLTLRNAATSKTFEKPFSMGNPLEGELTLSGGDIVYPHADKMLDINLTSKARTVNMNSATWEFHYKDHSGSWQSTSPVNLATAPSGRSFETSINVPIPSLSALSNITYLDLDKGTDAAFLRITVTDEGGSKKYVDLPVDFQNPIYGNMSVGAGYVYPLDNNTIGFEINTHSSAKFTSTNFSFKIQYKGLDGNDHEDTSGFTGLTAPDGTSTVYSSVGTPVTFPAISNYPDLTEPVTLVMHIRDEDGVEKDVTFDVPMHSHINQTDLVIVKGYGTTGFPVNAQLGLMPGDFNITSAALLWQQSGGAWQSHALTANTSSQQVLTTSLSGISLAAGSYVNYKLEGVCDDGTKVYSPVWSMKLLKYSYVPDGDTWTDTVTGLDYSRGDYVEAQMHMQYKNGSTEKDGLICFGNSIGTYAGKNFQFYLGQKPQQTPPKLRMTAYNFATRVEKTTGSADINMCFDAGGLYIQGQDFLTFWNLSGASATSYNSLINELIGNTTIDVGQMEGSNRSYSTYQYIRAVRQFEITEP